MHSALDILKCCMIENVQYKSIILQKKTLYLHAYYSFGPKDSFRLLGKIQVFQPLEQCVIFQASLMLLSGEITGTRNPIFVNLYQTQPKNWLKLN